MASDVEVNETILYDLLVHNEWTQEPEKVSRNRDKSQVTLPRRIAAISSRAAWTVFRTLGFGAGSGSPCLLPPGLVSLINAQIHWQLALAQDGRHVAILMDTDVEVRSVYDDFASVTGRACVTPRAREGGVTGARQWRHVAWSPCADWMAVSDSLGAVTVLDPLCTPLCVIPGWSPAPGEPEDPGCAVCSLIFTETSISAAVFELWIINYRGTLKKYAISETGSFRLLHTFSFSHYYPQGIGSVVHIPSVSVLVVGGCEDRDESLSDSQRAGLSMWRVLSGAPHCTLVTYLETDKLQARGRSRVFRRLKSMTSLSWWYGHEQDGVFSLALSPDAQRLACVHLSGKLSVWQVPGLQLLNKWGLEQQPGFDNLDPAVAENPRKRKQLKEHLSNFWLGDAQWWDPQSLILVRGTGSLTVVHSNTLANRLGACEWLEPAPRITPAAPGSGFLALEVESRQQSLKRHLNDSGGSSEASDDDDLDTDDEADLDLLTRSTRYVKAGLFYVTDIERFQPPRRKPRLVNRTYRLLCLKSTTPEELYARKIESEEYGEALALTQTYALDCDLVYQLMFMFMPTFIESEEYGEALALAQTYALDCDLVYQRQWRRTPVSVASIQDYLSKISKRSWVLHECLERVPENMDAMRELLQYGLRGTDLEALLAVQRGQDGGRFVLCDRAAAYEESIDSPLSADEQAEQAERSREHEREHREALRRQLQLDKLGLEEKELCRARLKLLQYLDRLATYEEVLGGIHVAAERYVATFFEQFRSKPILQLAVDYARRCDWRALDTLLCYHGDELLRHRLAILANFPETFPPREYTLLLPECSRDGAGVAEVIQARWREQDWVEEEDVRREVSLSPAVSDPDEWLYDENPDYINLRGRGGESGAVLTQWYSHRATEIEFYSRQVDHALELASLGLERGVRDLELLHDDLLTLSTLVYESRTASDGLSLADLRAMADIDKLRLLMIRSSEDMYVKDVRRWLLPFLARADVRCPGSQDGLLREYLLGMARSDLSRCLLIFQASKSHLSEPIIGSEPLLLSLALDCIYACRTTDQLTNAFAILECLPQRALGEDNPDMLALHGRVDELECHLGAAEVLEKHELPQTLAAIQQAQGDEALTRALLVKLTRVGARRDPAPAEDDWRDLLSDILALRERGMSCSIQEYYEIFVTSLLTSGRTEDVKLAGRLLETSAQEAQQPDYSREERDAVWGAFEKVAFTRSVELVLSAAREYFDASANLSDSNMDLARTCLRLITDPPSEVSQELDLISSLALLDGFGVRVLPLQVRMRSDRGALVKQAIYAKQYNYKQSQKLLQLGSLLHLPGDARAREGQVLRQVARAALDMGDHSSAHEACTRLRQAGYAPAWRECKALAEAEKFTDLRTKVELLAFAVTHCSVDVIESILRAKCLLQAQINYELLSLDTGREGSVGRESSSVRRGGEEESPSSTPEVTLSAAGSLQQIGAILSSTNKVTKSVLSHVSDRKWWSRTLTRMRPLVASTGGKGKSAGAAGEGAGEGRASTACHPFYGTVHKNGHESTREVDYFGLRMPREEAGTVCSAEGLLRVAKLEETVAEGAHFQPATEVLLQLARDTMSEDTTLALAYLLALPKAQETDACLLESDQSGISLQLTAYYYALQIYVRLVADRVTANTHPVYLHPPEEIVRKMLKLSKHSETIKQDGELSELTRRLAESHERFLDFTQAYALSQLGRGVDVSRLSKDNTYKKETILGLAMTTEDAVYNIAVSLARRNKLDMWDLYMSHLEFLFESELELSELEKRVRKLDILPTLQQRPADFAHRLKQYVWPVLEGRDHPRLLFYYSLLITPEAAAPSSAGTKGAEGVSTAGSKGAGGEEEGRSVGAGEDQPLAHVKLLKKLMGLAPELDYKRLVETGVNPLDVLRPVLTQANITQIAKLAPKMRCRDGGASLAPSVVYCAWALQHFWEGVGTVPRGGKKAAPSQPQTQDDWVHRYESCHEMVGRLAAPDFTQFIHNIVFDRKALEQLQVESRLEIVRRAVKYCRQQQAKSKQEPQPWAEACDALQRKQEHLSLLASPPLVAMVTGDNERHRHYVREFDLSQADPPKVEDLLVSIALAGECMEFIDEFLTACQLTSSFSVPAVVKTALLRATNALKEEQRSGSGQGESRDHLAEVKAVIGQVNKHIEDWGELVEVDDVMGLLRAFCGAADVAAHVRLDVLHVLESCFQLDAADSGLLLYYRTRALTAQWSQLELTEESVSTDAARLHLFEHLLQLSESREQESESRDKLSGSREQESESRDKLSGSREQESELRDKLSGSREQESESRDKLSGSPEQLRTLAQLLTVWPPLEALQGTTAEKHPLCCLLRVCVETAGDWQLALSLCRELHQSVPMSTQCVEYVWQLLAKNDHAVAGVKVALLYDQPTLHELAVASLADDALETDDELIQLLLQRHVLANLVTTPMYEPAVNYVLEHQTPPDTPSYLQVETLCFQLQEAGYSQEAGALLARYRGLHPSLLTWDAAYSVLSRWLHKP